MSRRSVAALPIAVFALLLQNNSVTTAQEITLVINRTLNTAKLREYLMKGYNPSAVPLDNDGRGINVTVYMWPYDILDVAAGAVKISGWFDMRWKDPYLQWDPNQFGGINEMFIARNQIWLPEIDIFYSKDGTGVADRCKDCPVRVTNEGQVLRGYYFSYSFPCHMNVKYFPFDRHNCTLELANWHLDQRTMDLYADNSTVDLSIFLDNAEWELIGMTAARKVDFYNYGLFPILSYVISIKRKPFYYITNLVVPTVVLTVTALIGYHMPSAGNGIHQEKIKMGVTTILSIYILQLGVSDKLPRTSDVVPLLSIFYSCMVGLLSLAIIATSFVILVEKQGVYGKPPPNWVVRFILRQPTTVSQSPKLHASCSSLFRSNANCRQLDCGCRLRQHQTVRYQQLTNVVSPAMRNRRSCVSTTTTEQITREHCDSTKNLVTLQVLTELRSMLYQFEAVMSAQRANEQVKEQWSRLADVLENFSLCVFLFGTLICIQLFLNHSWY